MNKIPPNNFVYFILITNIIQRSNYIKSKKTFKSKSADYDQIALYGCR